MAGAITSESKAMMKQYSQQKYRSRVHFYR